MDVARDKSAATPAPRSPPTTTLLLNPSLTGVAEFTLAGGSACVVARPHDADRVNQDSVALIEIDEHSAVLAVADGMGGGPAGDAASALALRTLCDAVAQSVDDGRVLRGGIMDGFEAAQRAVEALAAGAATTLMVAEIQQRSVRTYHAGDSAACLFGQRGKVKLQTAFHSPVGYALKSGMLDERAALTHAERHFVSNIIGLPGMTVEVGSTQPLAFYDTLVLGSDGLFDNFMIAEIGDQVRRGALPDAASSLRDRALARMHAPRPGEPSKPDDLAFVLFRPR